ncbi:MAG: HD domain-containing protein [Candidatus Micrarchaeota archaeon]|nr:HD domain-containing protein [Candidatus Micrarchaeota archaeon]
MPSLEKTFLLLQEALSLKNLPRSGWQAAKAKQESVAEHSFGVAIILLALARMERLSKKDEALALRLAILHDLHEARTGDLTPRQKISKKPNLAKVERQMLSGTHLQKEIALLKNKRLASLLRDADRLDMLFRALENLQKGNKNMGRFIRSALLQLRSESAKKLARLALLRSGKSLVHQFKCLLD